MIIICEAARITNLIIIWDWEATTSCAAQMWLCCRAVAKPSQSFHSARKAPTHLAPVQHSVLIVKALEGAFLKDKALVGAFSRHCENFGKVRCQL